MSAVDCERKVTAKICIPGFKLQDKIKMIKILISQKFFVVITFVHKMKKFKHFYNCEKSTKAY